MLDDLRGKRKSTEFVTWGQVGAWFERYARKIDNLPILNVDPEMLDYGIFVADGLRQSETAMKGIGARSGMRKTQLPNFYTTRTWATPVPVSRWRTAVAYGWSSQENLAARGQAEAKNWGWVPGVEPRGTSGEPPVLATGGSLHSPPGTPTLSLDGALG